ncbi:hypothetical protein LINGRAHAP2_LOCUS15345 [Linum grandiflorum]
MDSSGGDDERNRGSIENREGSNPNCPVQRGARILVHGALEAQGQPDRVRDNVLADLLLCEFRAECNDVYRAGGDIPGENEVDLPWDIGGVGKSGSIGGGVWVLVSGAGQR